MAKRYGGIRFSKDVWVEMFREAAKQEKTEGTSDLIPFWGLRETDDSVYIESTVSKEKDYFDHILDAIDPGIRLDEEQRRAVVTDDDYCLLVAGAGAGKTTTMAAKVKYLVEKQHVNPEEIIVISYTRKAIGELKDRINKGLQIPAEICTFHKFAFDIVYHYYQQTLKKNNEIDFADMINDAHAYLQEIEQQGIELPYYQLSVYLYAYSSFLEIVLSERYSREFLDQIKEKLGQYALQYREDYSACYDMLESYKKTSVESKALEWSGIAGKKAGTLLAKVPVLSKGPVDEALISAGEKLGKFGETKNKRFLLGFDENRDAGIQLFTENISTIDEMANKPVEMLFDKQCIYICA